MIDWNFLAKQYNRDHHTNFTGGVQMVADMYEKYGIKKTAEILKVNYKTIYRFMKKYQLSTYPKRNAILMPEKKCRVLAAVKQLPLGRAAQIAKLAKVSIPLVMYHMKQEALKA